MRVSFQKRIFEFYRVAMCIPNAAKTKRGQKKIASRANRGITNFGIRTYDSSSSPDG